MKIAFLCVANSARSQMAEGLARVIFDGRAEVLSAGSAPSRVHPLAIEVLAEVGVDIRHHQSKSTADIDLKSVDLIVTLCADEVCPIVPGMIRKLHWPFPDPAKPDRSLEEDREAFRAVREQIRVKLVALKAETIK